MLATSVGAALIALAFVVGRVTGDPTTTDDYMSQSKKLAAANAELDDSASQLEGLQTDLNDAEAQVDALVSDLPEDEQRTGPALSDGAAIAPRNIRIGLKTRSLECFGSAGCLVTVQADPDYIGNQDVSDGSWEITYEIRGGEDGPIVETMTLIDGTFSFPEEQSLSTTSKASKLKAVVTAVYALEG